MTREVIFLHGADLHLGSLLASSKKLPAQLQEKVREAVYTAFQRMVDTALNYEVDFAVLCGDIYDQTERSARAKRFFINQVERLNKAGIPVYVIYGNHDPLEQQVEFFQYPGNVYVFPAEQAEQCEVRGKDGAVIARVLGQSYSQPSEKRKLHHYLAPPDHDVVNVALLHTGLNPTYNNYVPCSPRELADSKYIDYWALGHIHKPQVISNSYPAAAFPGIPQGRDMGEPGWGGCFLVRAQPGKEPALQFVPTSPVIWIPVEVPLQEGLTSEEDLMALLTETAEQVLRGNKHIPGSELLASSARTPAIEGYIVRWHFTGRSEIHDIIQKDAEIAEGLVERMQEEFRGTSPFLWTEDIRFDTSSPLVNLANISSEDAVLNSLLQVYRELKEDDALRQELMGRNEVSRGWYEQKDPEDIRDKNFPLHGEVYESLLEKALYLAAQRIWEGRETR